MPLRQDVVVWRGNNVPGVSWSFDRSDELSSSLFSLTVSAFGEPVIAEVQVLVVDEVTKSVTWLPTLAESRLIPLGKVSTYELERRAGGVEETTHFGAVIGRGGANPDSGAPPLDNGTLDFSSPNSSGLTQMGWI